MILRSTHLFCAFVLGLLVPLFWGTAAQAKDDEMRALAHSRLPAQLLLNQGMTLFYGPAREALENAEADGFTAFGGMMGGHQEVSRNGETRMDGFSFLAGLGYRTLIDDSPLAAFTYGFFGEGGTGSFETSLNLGTGTAKSEGRGHYVGGGVLIKTEFQNRAYIDGVFRVGQADSSLKKLTLAGAPLDLPDASSTYFSAGGTLGWQTDLTDQLGLGVYGRLLWSHQGAAEKMDLVTVDTINSTRTVFGAKADFKAGEGRIIYLGAGWEHEFNGRARLTIDSRELKGFTANLEGDSLVGEVGLKLMGEDGFSASFGLDGALGRREALGGVLRLGYEF